jgi:hypothetical protein
MSQTGVAPSERGAKRTTNGIWRFSMKNEKLTRFFEKVYF